MKPSEEPNYLPPHTIRTAEGDITIGSWLRHIKQKAESRVIAVDVNNRMVRFASENENEATDRVAWKQLGEGDAQKYELIAEPTEGT